MGIRTRAWLELAGSDQSQQMLLRAHAKFAEVATLHVGLQELAFADTFDGIICMDVMENVFPEDWPLVLGKFHQALHSGGWLYSPSN